MTGLTAIDILILPDDTMLEHAKAWNARLLDSLPSGSALDAKHNPHITLLQRYVRTESLDDVYEAVGATLAEVAASSLVFTAVKLAHIELAALPGVGLAGLVCRAGEAVIERQSALIDAIRPLTGSGGDSRAFVTSPAEPDINSDTLTYVETYVPDHSGDKFLAHVTVGQGKLEDLTALEATTARRRLSCATGTCPDPPRERCSPGRWADGGRGLSSGVSGPDRRKWSCPSRAGRCRIVPGSTARSHADGNTRHGGSRGQVN